MLSSTTQADERACVSEFSERRSALAAIMKSMHFSHAACCTHSQYKMVNLDPDSLYSILSVQALCLCYARSLSLYIYIIRWRCAPHALNAFALPICSSLTDEKTELRRKKIDSWIEWPPFWRQGTDYERHICCRSLDPFEHLQWTIFEW